MTIKDLYDNDAIRPFNTNDNNVFAYAFGEKGGGQTFSSVHQALSVFKARYAIDKAATGKAEKHNEALLRQMRETTDGKALDKLESQIEMSVTADLWWERSGSSLEKECIRQSIIQSPEVYDVAKTAVTDQPTEALNEHQRLVNSVIEDIKYLDELRKIKTLERDENNRLWDIVKEAGTDDVRCLSTVGDIECLDINTPEDFKLIQDRRSGLYNYATREGEVLSNQWFPQASPFRDGKAVVADQDEKLFMIDRDFNAVDITREDLIKYGESLEKTMRKEELPSLQKQEEPKISSEEKKDEGIKLKR